LIVVVVQVSEDKKKRTKTGISHPISHQKRLPSIKKVVFHPSLDMGCIPTQLWFVNRFDN